MNAPVIALSVEPALARSITDVAHETHWPQNHRRAWRHFCWERKQNDDPMTLDAALGDWLWFLSGYLAAGARS